MLSRLTGEMGDRMLAEFQTRVANGNFGQVLKDAPQGGGGGPAAGGMGGPVRRRIGWVGHEPGTAPAGRAVRATEAQRHRAASELAQAAEVPQDPAAAEQISPGLVYLGTGRQEDLLLKAAREGVSVLALFNVEVKFNVKTNLVTNETELMLFDVAKKAKLDKGTTGKFNNLKVQNDRTNNKDDGLQKAYSDFFKFVDETLVVSPLPRV